MPVERMDVEELPEQRILPLKNGHAPTETPVKSQKTMEQREAEYNQAAVMMKVAAKILAVRLFLFLSLVGAYSLALIGVENRILIFYALVAILPLTVLEILGRKS